MNNSGWFTGVVEDVNDPEELGRVRVRCIGYHSESRVLIPTSSLPWATPIMPITSPSISGIGSSPTGLLCGSWVVGLFRDGSNAQDPIILGTIASRSAGANSSEGFSDPAGIHPRKPGSPDISASATSLYPLHFGYTQKKDLRQTEIETAIPPKVESVSVPEADVYYTRKTWSTPDPEDYIEPVYPHNKVTETLSGHLIEFDDTPGKERISTHHSSGSHEVIKSDGSRITTIVGSDFEIIISDSKIYVKGDRDITVDGSARTLIKGDYHLEVEGNFTSFVKGSVQNKIGLSRQEEIGQDFALNVGGNKLSAISGNTTTTYKGSVTESVGESMSLTVTGDMTTLVMSDSTTLVSGNSKSVTVGDAEYGVNGKIYQTSSNGIVFFSPGGVNLQGSGSSASGAVSGKVSFSADEIALSGSSSISIDSGSGGTALTSTGSITATDNNDLDGSIST